jgi:hypothetical protein
VRPGAWQRASGGSRRGDWHLTARLLDSEPRLAASGSSADHWKPYDGSQPLSDTGAARPLDPRGAEAGPLSLCTKGPATAEGGLRARSSSVQGRDDYRCLRLGGFRFPSNLGQISFYHHLAEAGAKLAPRLAAAGCSALTSWERLGRVSTGRPGRFPPVGPLLPQKRARPGRNRGGPNAVWWRDPSPSSAFQEEFRRRGRASSITAVWLTGRKFHIDPEA